MVEDDIANQAAESVGINEMDDFSNLGYHFGWNNRSFLEHGFRAIVAEKNNSFGKSTNQDCKQSDKALGSALGACVSYILSLQLVNSIESGSTTYEMPDVMLTILPNVFQFIIALAVVVWAFRLVNVVQDVVTMLDSDGVSDGTDKTLVSALESVLRFFIVFIGAIFIADAVGVNLLSYCWIRYFWSRILALAAKDTISNFFGALTVLLDRPFKVGDWVVVGTSEGEVIEINLRTTLIRTGIDTVITIPNANLVSTPVENYGKRRWRRWQTMLHFDISSNPDEVEAFRDDVLNSIQENAATMNEDSSWCRVSDISATSIDVSLNLYWDVQGGADERQEKEKFLLEIMQLAKQHKLSFYDNRIRKQSN